VWHLVSREAALGRGDVRCREPPRPGRRSSRAGPEQAQRPVVSGTARIRVVPREGAEGREVDAARADAVAVARRTVDESGERCGLVGRAVVEERDRVEHGGGERDDGRARG